MNSQWKAFLESRSARTDDEGTVQFPDAPIEADCALMDLSQLGLIGVKGPDAESFLQGQVTNDLVGLAKSSSQLGSHCSHKGRILASFRAFKLDDTVYLQLPLEKMDAMLQRLSVFVLRAKVTIDDASDRFATAGIAGDCAPSLLASHFDAVPDRDNALARSGDLILIRIPGTLPRFEILGPIPAMEAAWDDLTPATAVTNPDFWALLDIRAGIPSIYTNTSDAFVPQMVNLQLLAGVSFRKGCYTGQEVVARMQHLGKLKRRMYRAQISAKHRPSPGDTLHYPGSRSEQATGKVVDARINAEGDYELLVVAEIEAVDKGEVRLGGPEGPLLSFSDPPYGFHASDS